MPRPTIVDDTRGLQSKALKLASLVWCSPGMRSAFEARLNGMTVHTCTLCSGCDAVSVCLSAVSEKLWAHSGGLFRVNSKLLFACDSNPAAQRFIKLMHPDLLVFTDLQQLATPNAMADAVGFDHPVAFPRAQFSICGFWCGDVRLST